MASSSFTPEDASLLARMVRANPSHIEDMIDLIQALMDDADQTLRQSTDHAALLKAQGVRSGLETLVLHTYEKLSPKSKADKAKF